jgi:hypothetical protein
MEIYHHAEDLDYIMHVAVLFILLLSSGCMQLYFKLRYFENYRSSLLIASFNVTFEIFKEFLAYITVKIFKTIYDLIYDMIYLSTAIGFTPGGSGTVHTINA